MKGLMSCFSNFYPTTFFQKLKKIVSDRLFHPKGNLFFSMSIVFLVLILGEFIYWFTKVVNHIIGNASLGVGYPIYIGVYMDHILDSHLWTVWLWNGSLLLFILSVALKMLQKTNWLPILHDASGNKMMATWMLFLTGTALNIVSLFI